MKFSMLLQPVSLLKHMLNQFCANMFKGEHMLNQFCANMFKGESSADVILRNIPLLLFCVGTLEKQFVSNLV